MGFREQEEHALEHMRQYKAKLRELFPNALWLHDEVILEVDPNDEEEQRKLQELEKLFHEGLRPMGEEYVLLIWDQGSEGLEFFLLPFNVYEKYQTLLKDAHGKMINVDDMTPGLEFLNVALCAEEYRAQLEYEPEEHIGVLYQYRVSETSAPIKANIGLVIHSGFLP